MTETGVQAIGGYYEERDSTRIYPGPAQLKIEGGVLQKTWIEGLKENKPNRQRTGYMTALVPRPWMKCQ